MASPSSRCRSRAQIQQILWPRAQTLGALTVYALPSRLHVCRCSEIERLPDDRPYDVFMATVENIQWRCDDLGCLHVSYCTRCSTLGPLHRGNSLSPRTCVIFVNAPIGSSFRYTEWVRWDGVLLPIWDNLIGRELLHVGDDGTDFDGFENVNEVNWCLRWLWWVCVLLRSLPIRHGYRPSPTAMKYFLNPLSRRGLA